MVRRAGLYGAEDGGSPQPIPAIEVDDMVSAAATNASTIFLQYLENFISSLVDCVRPNDLHTHAQVLIT